MAVSPEAAASTLDAGGLVLVPTETVFGIAASATNPSALSRLASVMGAAATPPPPRPILAWHAPTAGRAAEALAAALGTLPPTHARVLDRLTPGPVLLSVELDPAQLSHLRGALGVGPGVIDDNREALVRVPSHPASSALLATCRSPVVMAGVAAPRRLRDSADALSVLESLGRSGLIDAVIDHPTPPLGKPSTLIRLSTARNASGTYEVAREGVYDAPFVERRLARNILFVCTGNTCRSPMAEAIARDLLTRAGHEGAAGSGGGTPRVIVDSAGTSAYPGAPATPEAVEALAAMNIPMTRHTSAPLTRAMLAEAEVVYAMTESHAHAARSIDPSSAAKIAVLDPDGGDIADPIGAPLSVYKSTARTIQGHIETRLRALGLL